MPASLPEKSAIAEARRVANAVVLTSFKSKITSYPAHDLSDLLKQQATNYPRLVESLAQSSHLAGDDSSDSECDEDTGTQPSPTDSLRVSAGQSFELIQPVGSLIIDYLLQDQTKEGELSFSGSLPEEFRLALNQRLASAEILHELHNNFVLGLGSDVVVKIGASLDPDHIYNLQYVHSSVLNFPAPQCLGAFRSGSLSYFFMSRAPGETLESVWPRLSTAQKISTQKQLNETFENLRAHVPPKPEQGFRMGSFATGLCKDTRRMQRLSHEDISTERKFNDFLCHAPRRTVTPWIRNIRSFMSETHAMVMTHGDLHPRNIMVSFKQDGVSTAGETTVTAILDWEFAGWYPEYWEFMKALNTISPRDPLQDWIDFLSAGSIGRYLVEYSIDCLIDKWLG